MEKTKEKHSNNFHYDTLEYHSVKNEIRYYEEIDLYCQYPISDRESARFPNRQDV